jgi:hypothetical protein
MQGNDSLWCMPGIVRRHGIVFGLSGMDAVARKPGMKAAWRQAAANVANVVDAGGAFAAPPASVERKSIHRDDQPLKA